MPDFPTPDRLDAATTLAKGAAMPVLGFGTWRMDDGKEVESAVATALEHGYRSIDTASVYGNEKGVGRALRDSGVPRDEVFVTTKLWNDDQGHDATLRAFDASLQRLGLEHLDLYLIHWPGPAHHESWQAMERLYEEGRVRAIGVSNFLPHHLDDLRAHCRVPPMVDQAELHPRLVQPQLQAHCRQSDVQIEAWSPLMKGRVGEIPELRAMAEELGRTSAQVVIRWQLERGIVTIPKSSKPQRIRENAAVFDFSLGEERLRRIEALEQAHRLGPHPDSFG